MSTFMKLVLGFIAFLIYGALVIYGCGLKDECLQQTKDVLLDKISQNPALSGIQVEQDKCGLLTMTGAVGNAAAKSQAIAACEGCGSRLDASGVVIQSIDNCILKASHNEAQNTIMLEGIVPNQKTKANILAIAERLHGKKNVSDKLQVYGLSGPRVDVFEQAATSGLPLLSYFDGDARLETTHQRTQFWGTVRTHSLERDMDELKEIESGYDVVHDKADIIVLDQSHCQEKLNGILSKHKILFKTSSAEISAKSNRLLVDLEDVLEQCESLNVVIEGHTDTRGDASENQKLSESRAKAVMNRLYKIGLRTGRATVLGLGETKPIADESTPGGLAKNRRIEFKLQGVK